MNCAACQNPIPADMIMCPLCAEEKGRPGIIDRQLQILPRVLSTEVPLNACNDGYRVHLVLFGIALKSWCWTKLPSAPRTRFTLPYSSADTKVTCTDCRRQLNALVARHRSQVLNKEQQSA